jgi:hypothetical protein
LTEDGKELDLELNFGEGKYYPGGPTCKYNGKVVDCLAYTSESGGITGEIMVEILTYFDSIDLFPRVPGRTIPMLIVDRHQSHLAPVFVLNILMTRTIPGRFALAFHMPQHCGR